jgi:multicomponent Na+:H+ antiporter subunit F
MLAAAAAFLLITLTGAMVRAQRGPDPADRMQALLALGTTLVAVLLLLGYACCDTALLDVALVFALLAAVISIAFATYPPDRGQGES